MTKKTQKITYILFFCILWIFPEIGFSQNFKNLSAHKDVNRIAGISSKGFYLLQNINHIPDGAEILRRSANGKTIIAYFQKPVILHSKDVGLYSLNTYHEWKLSPNFDSNAAYYLIKTNRHEQFKKKYQKIILQEYASFFIIRNTENLRQKLLRDEMVSYIEPFRRPKTEASVIGHDLTVNSISTAQNKFDLSGDGISVSVKEEVFDTSDIDLKNRTRLYGNETSNYSQHATTIATLIAGAGNSSWRGKGLAPKATLSSASFLNLLPEENTYFTDHNIFIQNHSYGTSIENFYGAQAAAYDQQIFDIPQLVHVFSSGNDGLSKSSVGIYSNVEGYANLTGNFKMAKNIITVGAVDKEEKPIGRSSKGPAYDGRIKPELVAYATTGTSDAAALVSGAVALEQEYFSNKNGMYPKADLVKATLFAGAKDVAREYPDFETGYGNLDLYSSLKILENGNYFSGLVEEGDTHSVSIEIPENTAEIKIALSWIDPPANPNDEVALVNDLDLSLIDPSGNEILPWVLDHRPDKNFLESLAQRKVDTLNNNELISLENPTPGNYTIKVKAHRLNTANQDFSVAYVLKKSKHFEWTFPDSTTAIIPGVRNMLRWESAFKTTGSLQIEFGDSGWQTIAENIDLSKGFFDFPEVDKNGEAHLKMVVADSEFISEAFVIAPVISPNVIYNCGDKIGISWPEVENSKAYRVSNLEGAYLQSVAETTSNFLEISKADLKSDILSVVPVFEDGLAGANGLSIDYTQQGVQCYYTNFFAFLVSDESVESSLNLTTKLNIASVDILRINEADTTSLAHFEQLPEDLNLSAIDEELPAGKNSYLAKINLTNGTSIFTNEVVINIPGQETFIVYPNPVKAGEEINIFSRGDDLQYQVFDLRGRLISEETLIQFNDRLPVQIMSPGIYIVRALRDEKVVGIKKLIVL